MPEPNFTKDAISSAANLRAEDDEEVLFASHFSRNCTVARARPLSSKYLDRIIPRQERC